MYFAGRKHAPPKTPSHANNMYYASPVLEEGLHSRQPFLVRLTNQFDDFFNPKNASETKATTNNKMFKANID